MVYFIDSYRSQQQYDRGVGGGFARNSQNTEFRFQFIYFLWIFIFFPIILTYFFSGGTFGRAKYVHVVLTVTQLKAPSFGVLGASSNLVLNVT
jgi:hypothetical protein